MRITNKQIAVICAVALAVLGGIAVAWSTRECALLARPFACYLERTNEMLREGGVMPALAYAHDVVIPEGGYSIAHFMLHTVGEYAYGTSGNLDEALGYLEAYRRETAPDPLLGFEGFVHGVLSSHFLARGNVSEYPALMSEVCEGNHSIQGVTDSVRNCYHALGHALVHASANAVLPALGACITAPTDEARQGCYYGAFMELVYLYIPEYHPGAPRPDSSGTSLRERCMTVPEDAQIQCFHFVGQSYLYARDNDFAGAFDECARLPSERESCALRLGFISVTTLVHDEEEAREFCAVHAGTLEEACARGAIEGITLGFTPDQGF